MIPVVKVCAVEGIDGWHADPSQPIGDSDRFGILIPCDSEAEREQRIAQIETLLAGAPRPESEP